MGDPSTSTIWKISVIVQLLVIYLKRGKIPLSLHTLHDTRVFFIYREEFTWEKFQIFLVSSFINVGYFFSNTWNEVLRILMWISRTFTGEKSSCDIVKLSDVIFVPLLDNHSRKFEIQNISQLRNIDVNKKRETTSVFLSIFPIFFFFLSSSFVISKNFLRFNYFCMIGGVGNFRKFTLPSKNFKWRHQLLNQIFPQFKFWFPNIYFASHWMGHFKKVTFVVYLEEI